jgi:hydrogenase maturation protease
VLSAADLLGDYPSRLALVGCQPLDLENWGGPLTAPVRDAIEGAIEAARGLLRGWGVDCVPRAEPLSPEQALLGHDIDHLNYEGQKGVAAVGEWRN